MKRIFYIFCFICILSPILKADAEEGQSTWILLTGRAGTKTWWTIQELHLDNIGDAYSDYENAVMTKLLMGIFKGSELVIDRKRLRLASRGPSQTLQDHGPAAIIHFLLKRLTMREDVRFSLELPLEEALLYQRSPAFIHTPVIARLTPRPADMRFHVNLANHLAMNVKNLSLALDQPRPLQSMKPETLERFWERTLLLRLDGLKATYSSKLDTLFFTMPEGQRHAFYDTCESILSGNQ